MLQAFKINLIIILIFFAVSQTAYSEVEKFKFDSSIDLMGDGNVLYSKYEGIFAPMNTFINLEVLDINLNSKKIKIVPAQPETRQTVEITAEDHNAIAAMNAGFFDVTNGMSVSYVIVDGKKIGVPEKNTNLTSNPAIKPFLKDIYNRAELKIYDCNDTIKYDINFHNKSKPDCDLIHSLQGGPMLLPHLDLSKESFLVYKDGKKIRESANVSNKDARVAVALTKDNHMLWFLVKAGFRNSTYYGLTIKQMADLIKHFNVKSALAYDGGSSTTLYVRLPDGTSQVTIGDVTPEGDRIQARVKSVLLLLGSN